MNHGFLQLFVAIGLAYADCRAAVLVVGIVGGVLKEHIFIDKCRYFF